MITPIDYPSIILRVQVIILRVQGIIQAQGVILRAAKDSWSHQPVNAQTAQWLSSSPGGYSIHDGSFIERSSFEYFAQPEEFMEELNLRTNPR